MLIEPVDLLAPQQVGAVHFIAIGGSGMSAIALLYRELGVEVSGSDRADSPALDALRAAGIRCFVGHDPSQLGAAQTVVVSSAIPESNVELEQARLRGLRIWHRSAALGSLMLGRRGIAVTGTHGKTTTSAMTTMVLGATGNQPGYVVGSPLADTGRAASVGTSQDFVIEADESDGSFRQYPAETFVVTNIDADHLDNWGTPQAYWDGYLQAVRGETVRRVVACADDEGAARLITALRDDNRQVLTYGTTTNADLRLDDVSIRGTQSQATLIYQGQSQPLLLPVPGIHNLRNAAAAVATGILHGIAFAEATRALSGFHGTARRFERVGDAAGVRVFDDYAHHPTEVAAALDAARSVAGSGRVIACFQPHLFSRTQTFRAEFAQALAKADVVVLCPIYPAREDPIPGVTTELIGDLLSSAPAHPEVQLVATLAEASDVVSQVARPGDLVVTIGAGDVTSVGPATVAKLERP